MSGEEALAKTRTLLAAAVAPGASTQAKRAFQEYLTTLPSHPSYQCKSFFGTLISKFFAEFEDLQDRIVDAVLDLCEDEDAKTRIVGIKGLATTAKADPRWVRGNAGVLLQLLECPPGELEHVKQSLHTLLSITPAEVFTVMAEACCGSEEETGASRRNILDYLRRDTADLRRDVLESGNNPEAEKAFREGFIRSMSLAQADETKTVIDLLLPLSSITGRTATTDSTSAFLKALTTSLAKRSDISSTKPYLTALDTFLARRPPFEPRFLLSFVALHGEALIELAFEGDAAARRIVENLRLSIPRSVDAWKSNTEVGDAILKERDVVKAFATEVVAAVVDGCKNVRLEKLRSLADVLETLLWSVYQLMHLRDLRRDAIGSADGRRLRDLAKDASQVLGRMQRRSPAEQQWLNIRNMAEDLSDDRDRLASITPSWSLPSSSRSQVGQTHGRPATPPQPPMEHATAPDQARKPEHPRSGARTREQRPESNETAKQDLAQRTNGSTSIREPLPERQRQSVRAAQRDPLGQGKPDQSSRKGEELLGASNSSTEASQKGKELLGVTVQIASKAAPSTETQSTPKDASNSAASGTPLLSRLSGASGKTISPAATTSTAPSSSSLLSRLNKPDPKSAGAAGAVKGAVAGAAPSGTPSRPLKDRLNGSANGSGSSPAGQVAEIPGPTELSIRSRAQQASTAPQSILNRSDNGRARPNETAAGISAKQASPATAAFSIKGGAAKRPLDVDDRDDEEPVVYKKKGRGHQREEDSSGDIVMTAPAVRQVVQPFKPQVSASLGSRLGVVAAGPATPAKGKGSLAGRLSRPVRR